MAYCGSLVALRDSGVQDGFAIAYPSIASLQPHWMLLLLL